jgi:hypothetical protein
MLTIRKEQLAQLSASQRAEYCRRLMKFFRRTLPYETGKLDDGKLLEIIEGATERATAYGIKTGKGVVTFITLILIVNRNFDEDPAVKRYLGRTDLDADFKMGLLADLLQSRLGSVGNK